MISGFLLVDKPSGPTSHDVIHMLRKITGEKKIGHAGTLDPFASGLLLVGVGEATKLLRHYVGLDKTYESILRLGATSDTQDKTGTITKLETTLRPIPKSEIEKIIKKFIGKQKQLPPMYSAKKIAGRKLYELAREGKEVSRKKADVEIYAIRILSYQFPLLTIQCSVSSGTYIRTLGHDIGTELGCGAYVEELRRTSISNFSVDDATALDDADWEESFIPMKTVLVSGTFDGIHEGHQSYFQQARQLGHRVFCIVGRSSVVERIKGKKPDFSDKKRVALVKACDEIDRVYLGIDDSDEKVFDFVASLQPDVVALGYDQEAYTHNLESEMKKRGLHTDVVRLKPFKETEQKNSLLKRKDPSA